MRDAPKRRNIIRFGQMCRFGNHAEDNHVVDNHAVDNNVVGNHAIVFWIKVMGDMANRVVFDTCVAKKAAPPLPMVRDFCGGASFNDFNLKPSLADIPLLKWRKFLGKTPLCLDILWRVLRGKKARGLIDTDKQGNGGAVALRFNFTI